MASSVHLSRKSDHAEVEGGERSAAIANLLRAAGLSLGLIGAVPFWFNVETLLTKVVATLICMTLIITLWSMIDLWRRRRLERRLAIGVGSFAALTLTSLFVITNARDEDIAGLQQKLARSESEIDKLRADNANRQAGESNSETGSNRQLGSSGTPVTPSSDASVRYLAKEQSITRQFETGPARLNARNYEEAMLGSCAYNNPPQIYLIDRKYKRFRATVGIADDSSDITPVRFGVYDDTGKRLGSASVDGTTTPGKIDVSIEGVLRLSLRILPGEGIDFYNCDEVTAVWADARVER
jgi:hypothetical protein